MSPEMDRRLCIISRLASSHYSFLIPPPPPTTAHIGCFGRRWQTLRSLLDSLPERRTRRIHVVGCPSRFRPAPRTDSSLITSRVKPRRHDVSESILNHNTKLDSFFCKAGFPATRSALRGARRTGFLRTRNTRSSSSAAAGTESPLSRDSSTSDPPPFSPQIPAMSLAGTWRLFSARHPPPRT